MLSTGLTNPIQSEPPIYALAFGLPQDALPPAAVPLSRCLPDGVRNDRQHGSVPYSRSPDQRSQD